MRIKRYEAPTIQEALVKVKRDLGPEAVILYTKTFRKGGVLGLFGRPMAEITAGVDLNLLDDISKRKSQQQISTEGVDHPDRIWVKKNEAVGVHPPSNSIELNRTKAKTLQRELNEMKASSFVHVSRDPNRGDSSALLSEGFVRLKKKFAKQEVEDFLIQKMVREMIAERVDPERGSEVFSWVHGFVSSTLKVAQTSPGSKYQKIIAFVGPTGVGKTTTLAKLAARFSLMEQKTVVMITADTYRIAATEQLKIYGRIMGIPVEVANSAENISEILAKYKNVDIVLLDTAGRSPSSDSQLDELKVFISKSQPDEIHLVISATTKYFDMIRIIERFGSSAPINRMIFTKLDETRFYGALLNLMNNFQIPLSYYSVGQNVPDDLEIPDVSKLADRITKTLLG
jgi:flagellar biosynthesis protein FlhF